VFLYGRQSILNFADFPHKDVSNFKSWIDPIEGQACMSMHMATGDTTAMVGPYADLVGMVSVAVQTVPHSFVFSFPFLSFITMFYVIYTLGSIPGEKSA
jgi:hypothetical protein